MTREEALQRKQELSAEREDFKANQQKILSQVLLDPTTGGKGQPVGTQITKEQALERKKQLQAERQALAQNQEQPVAAQASNDKPWYQKALSIAEQVAPFTPLGIIAGAPGQMIDLYNQGKGLYQEVTTPGEVPASVAGVRSGINALTFGHAPQLAAGIEAPFSDKTYPELKSQYQDYYGKSATEKPISSALGSQVAMELASRGLNKYLPGFRIGSEPAGALKTTGKILTDLGLGALKGEATGLAGTYGVNPNQDMPLTDRLTYAAPSAAINAVGAALPRVGSTIGREEANKEFLMKPYEQEVQRRRDAQSASLGKAKVIEKQIPKLIQDKDIEYGKLKENPAYYEKKVDVTGFFDQLAKTVEDIKKQSPANMNTAQKQEFLSKVDEIKNKFTKEYGTAKTSVVGSEPSRILDESGVPYSKPVQKTTKEFQAKEIPFSEAHALQEVVNESFGEGGLLNKLRKPLDNVLSNVDDKKLAEQFKTAKSAYQKQKQAERFVQRKGKPEGLPEARVYKPTVPGAEMSTSASAIRDLFNIIPTPQGMKLGNIIEGPYHPMLTPTPAMKAAQNFIQPTLSSLANLATIGTTLGLFR